MSITDESTYIIKYVDLDSERMPDTQQYVIHATSEEEAIDIFFNRISRDINPEITSIRVVD